MSEKKDSVWLWVLQLLLALFVGVLAGGLAQEAGVHDDCRAYLKQATAEDSTRVLLAFSDCWEVADE